jgi:hypothetical protein
VKAAATACAATLALLTGLLVLGAGHDSAAGTGSDLAGAPTAEARRDIPPAYLRWYLDAAHTCPGLPWWISTRFDDLIEKHGRVRRRHIEEGWPPDRITRQHRVSERAVRGAIQGVPLPPIRFHDLRHGAATLALLGKVDIKVISETLGHSRHSFTADTYTSVLPEVSRAAAEAVAAVVPRMSADDATDEQARPSVPPNVISLADRRRSRTEHAG